MDESGRKISLKHKHKSGSAIDKLKSERVGDLIQSVTTLLQKIQRGVPHKEFQFTPERILKTLVRGLGSSNIQVQKNYFAALVTLLNNLQGSPGFSVRDILNVVESECHIVGNIKKGEEGEILLGKVLAIGALIRSGALTTAAVDDQAAAVIQLLQDVKGKSYLPLIGDSFLVDYLKQIDESVFKKAVWPSLCKEVCPGPKQTLFMYHILLVCEERFPSVVSAKFLKQTLTVPQVLSTVTAPLLLSALKNDFRINAINHSAYSDIFKYLANTSEEVLQHFWQEVETQLQLDSTEVSSKQITAIQFFSLIVTQLQNSSQVLNLLTPKLLPWFMKKHKLSRNLKEVLVKCCKEALDNLYKLCTKADSSKTIISVIKKLLFDPGNILFEQFSGTRVIQQLMGHLKEKGVVKLATTFRTMITGSSSTTEHKGSETTTRPWHNKEKLYTVHLFCKLLSLPVVQANMEWRLEQLTFLFDMGFFPTSNVGVELAGHIRESFFSCLNHKLPNLVDLRNILAGVVDHINNRFDNGDQLRIKVPSEVIPAWKKMLATAKQIGENKKHKKEQWVTSVFQTMFYHIGLHLFKEAAFATDVLQELHSVYKRVGNTVSIEEEPHWTEVVVEMFLSLLSRNSQLHRHLIGCIFSHFCPIMIPQNIHQILQVLDPSSNSNPLLNSLDPDSETSSDEEESDEDDGEDEDKESSDDDISDEPEEEEEEKVNDKLRRAVCEALGDTGALTDVESVDLDDMDEKEAARVDKALSQAFRTIKQVKSKKQPSYAKALTHFRLRVLDLIEVWLGSEPPLDLMVDTLLKLMSLLEHSLVDKHQAPLETRVRSIIKKLTATKKYDVSDCKSLHLGNILKSLLEKGNRTTTVYMSVSKELTACTVFITKASHFVDEREADEDSINISVTSALKDIIKSFFLQRDCLLTVALFQDLFKLNVPCICSLASKLPSFAFDPSVHPFRRSKALEFLMTMWKNNRNLQDARDENLELLRKISKRLYKGSLKMIDEPIGRVQPRFMLLLKEAFEIIRSRKWMTDVNWQEHFHALTEFQKTLITKNNAKTEEKVNGLSDRGIVEEMEVENGDGDKASSQSESEEELENATEEDMNTADEANVHTADNEEKDISEDEETEINEDGEKDGSTVQESEESSSDSKEPSEKRSKKKSDKKRSHEKIKRTHLLKSNSKRMRLESMGVGLEENFFSKYNMLVNNTTPPSPER